MIKALLIYISIIQSCERLLGKTLIKELPSVLLILEILEIGSVPILKHAGATKVRALSIV